MILMIYLACIVWFDVLMHGTWKKGISHNITITDWETTSSDVPKQINFTQGKMMLNWAVVKLGSTHIITCISSVRWMILKDCDCIWVAKVQPAPHNTPMNTIYNWFLTKQTLEKYFSVYIQDHVPFPFVSSDGFLVNLETCTARLPPTCPLH